MKKIAAMAGFCMVLAACGGGNGGEVAAQPQSGSPAISGSTAHQQINAIRAKADMPPLARNAQLDAAAFAHAKDMAANNFMGHKGSDGSTVGQRVRRAGYGWCSLGENVSQGYASESSAIDGWRRSPGHYRNLVKRKVNEFGMAHVNGYRVLVVGARRC
ncbi:CAP domain-containing protein [Sulfitobacter sp. F26169L]|uniref:CAP domain-containing protein n=1 Tax=Sulfitobacter sp. F26169L TaxID=2996015 RepID=UPI002260F9B9|nr:CAP domain-containing protein [Sulfitobacter sp. F26169L]MCX7564793.1 CAP domain-containing protein [Sulfitobacter sp. F26169L]